LESFVTDDVGRIDELNRLAALDDLNILDTHSEQVFDGYTQIATQLFRVPIALISLVAADRQWFKSCVGLDVPGTPRNVAFCDRTIRESRVLIVPDATLDPRFSDNPLVTGAPHIRFYAGAPLVTAEGFRIGTVCIIDTAPRDDFSAADATTLETLAKSVMSALNLRNSALNSAQIARIAADRLKLLSLAEQMAHVGTWSWDAISDVTEWSAEVYAIHGLDPAQSPPALEGVLALYSPVDSVKLRGLIDRALVEGVDYDLEATVVRPDGSRRTVIARGTVRRSDEGLTEMLLGTFQDITHLRRTDRQIRESEARFRLLAESTTDLILMVDADGLIEFASPGAAILGYRPEDLVGRHRLSLVHPDDRKRARVSIDRLVDQKNARDRSARDYRFKRADGSFTWLEGNSRVVRNDDGELIAVISAFRDVTLRKDYEAVLEDARDQALRAVKAKSDFLANMSHEIRTPLTGVLGFAALLEKIPGLPPPASTYIQRILAGGDALLVVVNDILDLARIEAGQIDIEDVVFDPNILVCETTDLIETQARAKNIIVEVISRSQIPAAVHGDPARLRQILLNFLSNAVKFTQSGRITISLDYGVESPGPLRVSVSDTGIGIPADRINVIFQRFTQADNSISRIYGGTGLGLAIANNLARLMGGVVGVQSVHGKGSTFWVELPAPIADTRDSSYGEHQNEGASRSIRLLIVDDLAVNRELIRHILEPFDIALSEAENGIEAIATASQEVFDIVLMDIQMPGMDGLEATRRLRSEPGPNQYVPIIALSADTLPEHLEACRLAGMNDHIAKPINVARLVERISYWTTRSDDAAN
jgi:PAS domain S-box-containing protein